MRPSPRFSLFAILCGTAFFATPSFSACKVYNMTADSTGITVSGWASSETGTKSGYVQLSKLASVISTTETYLGSITNVVIDYTTSSTSPSRIPHVVGMKGGVEFYDALTFPIPAEKDTRTIATAIFDPNSEIEGLKFKVVGSGSAGNWTIYTVTVYTVDPPPTIDAISDQEVGSANTLTVSGITVSSFTGDNIQVTASATCGGANVDPTSYSISLGANGLYTLTFTPATAGINSGVVSFTVTATGAGGATSESFDCTVTTGVIKTKPTIDPIPSQSIHTLHTLYVPFVVREADEGDWVITNAPAVVSSTIPQGPFGYDQNGIFFFTPDPADAVLSPVVFSITARDPEGDSDPATISVVILPGTPPSISPIAQQTVAYGSTNFVTIAISETEDDPITTTNLAVKTGTDAPAGDFAVENGKAWFAPAEADIGNTFSFTLAVADIHGSSSTNYDVSVILAAPVLKHCPVDDWTATSFTADIEAAVPGATSYNLRYIRHEDDGTPVTNTVSVASFPHVVSGLATTNYVYDVQAIRGAVTSEWSNAKSIDLHAYIAPTYAIPMKGAARGSHHETFDGLISSGSAYWYDARTIPGWYAASSSGSMSDVKYSANSGGSSGTGLFSCQVDDEAVTNRALAVRADTQSDEFSFGVMFTNMCKYAVTNLHVSFTAMQFRRYNPISHLYFSYTRSNRLIDYNDPANIWTSVEALDFAAPTQGSSARLYPPTEEPKSADIPFEGVNAIQPGEVIAMRWYLDAKSNWPTLGIDDVTVSWECAWPRHTVIYLR
jgi:hypothetical protein